MSDLFELASLRLGSLQNGFAPTTLLAASNGVAGRENRVAANLFVGAELKRQLAGVERYLDKSEKSFEVLARARSGVSRISELISEARALLDDVEASPTSSATLEVETVTTVTYGTVSGTGTVSLADNVAVSVSGEVSLQAEAVAEGSGSAALSADAAATVTGDTDVGSSGNLILGTSLGQGQTLTVEIDSTVTTITFGVLGGQVNSSAELESALDAIDGLEASFDGDGQLVLTSSDADTAFTIGGTADIEAALGIAEQAYETTNLLSQGLVQGETLTFQVGGGDVQTITFGTDAGEVSTLAELGAALAALSDVSAQLEADNTISFSGLSASDSIVVGGSADLDGVFGIEAGTYQPTNLLTQGVAQGETLIFQVGEGDVQTITFGTGTGEIDTLEELGTALEALTGLSATLDGSNRIIFEASDAEVTVSVGGTVDAQAAFGLYQQSYQPANLLDQGVSQGQTLTFQADGGELETITFGSGGDEVSSVVQLDAALQALTGVTAYIDGSNRIAFSATASGVSVSVGGTADIAGAFGLTEGTTEADSTTTVTETVVGVTTSTSTDSTSRARYNQVLLEIDRLVAGAGFRGTNLLAGDSHAVGLALDGSASHTMSGQNVSLDSLGLSLLSEEALQDETFASQAAAALDAAVEVLAGVSQSLEGHEALLTSRSDFAKEISKLVSSPATVIEAVVLNENGALSLSAEVAGYLREQAPQQPDALRTLSSLAAGRPFVGAVGDSVRLGDGVLTVSTGALDSFLDRTVAVV